MAKALDMEIFIFYNNKSKMNQMMMTNVDLSSFVARKSDQLNRVSGNDVIFATKNVVHNSRYLVQQAERGSDITADALTAGVIASGGDPRIAGLAVAASLTSVALNATDVTLEQVENELNNSFPNVSRSSKKVNFTREDLNKPISQIIKKGALGFVEGDLASNKIGLLDNAERFQQDIERLSGPVSEPISAARDVRNVTKSTQRRIVKATAEPVRQGIQEVKDIAKASIDIAKQGLGVFQ